MLEVLDGPGQQLQKADPFVFDAAVQGDERVLFAVGLRHGDGDMLADGAVVDNHVFIS